MARVRHVRSANGLQYFLTDHLGSTVAVTDASGTLTSQQRYLPFGQVRTNVTSPNPQLPITDLGYTGQRQLDEGMGGLMDYKFRMYSPVLGRFISPDTITPGGPQGLNRFAYVLNNPIGYNDPSGHKVCEGDADSFDTCNAYGSLDDELLHFGIRLSNGWEKKDKKAILLGAETVGAKFASENGVGETATEAFKRIYGFTKFEWGCTECTKLGRTVDSDLIKFRAFYAVSNDYDMLMNTMLVIHELGHMFENIIEYSLPDGTLYKPARSSLPSNLANNRDGFGTLWIYQQSDDISSGEIFADMFAGWAVGVWALKVDGTLTDMATDRNNWMNNNMSAFIDMVP